MQSQFIRGAGILFEDQQIVVIATGANGARKSKNAKTGKMAQIWILVRSEDPIAAVRSGQDEVICFDCPLRGVLGKERGCYLGAYELAHAPLSIWRAYRRGRYQTIKTAKQISELFADTAVRFGAYGEPIRIPFKTVKAITAVAKTWTGYTHQWRNPLYKAYRQYFMASCTAGDYEAAQAMGWRTFTVSGQHLDNQIVCPASKERGHKLSCEDCGLCSGLTRSKARSVQIKAHGAGAQYAVAA